jgi:hypothetical protein
VEATCVWVEYARVEDFVSSVGPVGLDDNVSSVDTGRVENGVFSEEPVRVEDFVSSVGRIA